MKSDKECLDCRFEDFEGTQTYSAGHGQEALYAQPRSDAILMTTTR